MSHHDSHGQIEYVAQDRATGKCERRVWFVTNLRAEQLIKQKNFVDAERVIRSTLQQHPDDAKAFYLMSELARIYDKVDIQYVYLNKASKSDDFAKAFQSFCKKYKLYFQIEITLEHGDDISLKNEETKYLNKIQSLSNKHDYKSAKDVCFIALKTLPRSHVIYNALAVVCKNLGQLSLAILYYEIALGFSPKNCIYLSNLGNCLCKTKRYREAETRLIQALEIQPNFDRLHLTLLCLTMMKKNTLNPKCILKSVWRQMQIT